MENRFLELIQIPLSHKNTILSEMADYYKSTLLIQDISKLINLKFHTNQVEGKKILLKPNWVRHSSSLSHELCMRTNDNMIIALVDTLIKMRPSKITIGDAPIQGCDWNRMISKSFINEINKLSENSKVSIEIKDFRRRIYNFSNNKASSEIKPISDYVIFDLGKASMLEPVTTHENKFRVTNYDPRRMSLSHYPGVHKYCITKDFFDADIIISLPKIKTHQKTALTGALKNLVGINGDKDFLPHHRIGGNKMGGDCYPGRSILRYYSELLLDNANRNQGMITFWLWQKLSSILWRLSLPNSEQNLAAGWYGNDTTWRMVWDLNKIALFGKSDGTIGANQQREVYSLCDGIIAGQGDGPLEPKALPLGIITFTNDSWLNDITVAILIGLPIDKIPLLSYNLYENKTFCEISINGRTKKIGDLKCIIKAVSPKGWANYLNKT